MEIEKPFKCSVCSARFTNEDHLQVHKKRHEMSLNLSKSGLPSNNLADGFVDETPTPTRFIRNCEEVGLFQDLQNVNPFDEQFTKAASSTPSNENFEFNFTESMKSKSTDDTLNTPQVFGYAVSSTTVPSSEPTESSSVIQNPGISTTCSTSSCSGSSVPVNGSPSDLERDSSSSAPLDSSSKRSVVACSAEESRVESTTPDNESFISPIFSLKDDDEDKLRLDLSSSSSSTEIPNEDLSSTQKLRPAAEDEKDVYSEQPRPVKIPRKEIDLRKAELLERNRAAASRSRERRKQWVSGLETKCQTLQALLSTAQCEVAKLRVENNILRDELAKHANCDVTRAEPRRATVVSRTVTPEFQPQILKHSPTTAQVIRTSPSVIPSSILSTSPVTASALLKTTVISTPGGSVPPVKPKRGRPRKGHEKRLLGISIPAPPKSPHITPVLPIPASATAATASNNEIPMKVEILPFKSVVGKPITNVIILKPSV